VYSLVLKLLCEIGHWCKLCGDSDSEGAEISFAQSHVRPCLTLKHLRSFRLGAEPHPAVREFEVLSSRVEVVKPRSSREERPRTPRYKFDKNGGVGGLCELSVLSAIIFLKLVPFNNSPVISIKCHGHKHERSRYRWWRLYWQPLG
jgi:hypothetical protein